MPDYTLADLPGFHNAPNIHSDPAIYEIENEAADPAGEIEAAMWQLGSWEGKIVLDLGAGTGFHVPRFHTAASHIFAVEPHPISRLLAMQRVSRLGLEKASVLTGSAEQIPLRDHSVDVCHARFAYFFGSGCEPGLREVARVMRPGGTFFVIDNDLRRGTFAQWLQQHPNFSRVHADDIEAFWAAQGFALQRIPSAWQFQSRGDLEAVVRLEFGSELAEKLLAGRDALSVEYHYCLYYRLY